jgi:hypothetical protein
MTINPHIIKALAGQRVADLRREAEAFRLAAECDRRQEAERPSARPQPAHTAGQAFTTPGTQER